VIRADDGVRPGTSAAGLGKLRAVFKKDGSTTAGNSSQARQPRPVVALTGAGSASHRPCLALAVRRRIFSGRAAED